MLLPPPGRLTTETVVGTRPPCMIFCMMRAVRSWPPPAPPGTISSTFFSGFHACPAAAADHNADAAASAAAQAWSARRTGRLMAVSAGIRVLRETGCSDCIRSAFAAGPAGGAFPRPRYGYGTWYNFVTDSSVMALSPLTALSPLDGRYHSKLAGLRDTFSELGLI